MGESPKGMKDVLLNKGTKAHFNQKIDALLGSGKDYEVTVTTWKEKRSIPQLRTWRMWMEETAKHMAAAGVMIYAHREDGEIIKSIKPRPFNKEDAHELFVGLHGGHNADGLRELTGEAKVSFMQHIMDRHLQWCGERCIIITIPHRGQYYDLMDRQHET